MRDLFFSRTGPHAATQVAIALAASLAAAYSIIAIDDPVLTLGLFGVAVLAVAGFAMPTVFLVLFLLTRPMLDKLGGVHVLGLNPAGALGLLLVAVMVARIITSETQYRPKATGAFAIVLLLSAFACVPAFVDFGGKVGTKPVSEIVRLSAMLAVYVLAAQLISTPKALNRLFVGVGLSGFVPAVWGCIEWTHAPNASGLTIARIGGPFDGPNPFGVYLALTALVLIALPRTALPMWVRLGALAPMLVALVGTYSRGGWALFIIGFALIMWRRNPGAVALGAAVLVVLIGAVPSIHDRVLPPANPSTAPVGGGGVATPESFEFRLGNWNALLGKWAERPVTGYGLATVPAVNPRQLRLEGEKPTGYDAHNSAVKLLVEGGVVLLVAWIALIAILLTRTRQLSRRDWPFSGQARALFSIWIGVIVIGLGTDDPLAATAMMYALLALTGAVEGTFARWPRRPPGQPATADAPTGTIAS
jgi:O-antigen ligase